LNRAILLNIVGFQIGWFAAVLGAAHSAAALGTTIALAIVLLHLLRAPRPRDELVLIALAAAAGTTFDSLLAWSGWVEYAHGALLPNIAPHWIVALWILFASTLNVSLAWLKHRLAMATILGVVGGPLAYLGGEKLGALTLAVPAAALCALALGWGAVTPALLIAARRFDGFRPRSPAIPGNPEVRHA